ncbi:Gfo/Idh/MocA family protein [Paenibacillus koleovorans]|uniref:Gfo/Idh/MocA family protein n=1 Tax=Paenibacillus koleovorans TaxID=121608 RepID=UPI000FD7E3A5|nr:Gfo/Idh/MocA family oxidoreductase [Paenibacillus koleovorans]
MSASRIRVGVIGAGNIGNVHLAGFVKETELCEVVGVTDTFLPLAKSRAEQYGIAKVYESPEEMIASPDIDAVVICVPNAFHAPLAVSAMEAGKHVLLEKPMGISADAARGIVRTQEKTGMTLMVAHQMRWEPLALQIKEQVDKGELGRIYTAKAGWYRRKGIPGWGTWFTKMSEAGGGPLIDIGVHMLDLSLHLMGSPKPVAVSGATYSEFGPNRKGIGTWGKPNWDGYYDVEDLATAFIRMEDGSSLTLEVSWAVHMDTDNTPFIHLMGTEGGVALHGSKGKFLTEKFDQPLEVELNAPTNDAGSRTRLTQHFLDCVQNGKKPLTDVMTGFTNNLILGAIYESSRTGNEVKLDWSY